MRSNNGARGAPANSPNSTVTPGFDRSQSPPPSSPKNTPAQMVTRRAARRRADANEQVSDLPPPVKVPRKRRNLPGGGNGQRTAEGPENNVDQSATDSSPLEEVDSATFLRALVDKAKDHALVANRHRRAEEMETVYQSSLGNARLTSLLEANLRDTASPQEAVDFHRYIRDARKQRRSDSTRSTDSWTAQATPITDAQRERAAKQRLSTRKDSTMARTNMQPPTVPQPQAQRQSATPQVEATPQVDIPTLLATFCTSALWPRYCLLLPGRGTAPEFEALTTTQVSDRGERSPAHPAPKSWLSEAQAQLTRLLEHARPDRQTLIPKVMEKPGYKGQDVHVLLGEEVRWAIHEGPFKGKRQRGEIGLLIECVGIERKGMFWKG